MKATTVRLDRDLDPVKLGARTGLLWRRGAFALAGYGEALRVLFERPSGAVAVQERLAELAGPDQVDRPGTGPVAFGALPFAPGAAGELVVPELIVGRSEDGHRWLTLVGDGSTPTDAAEATLAAMLDRPAAATTPQPRRFTVEAAVAPEEWRDRTVGDARDRIRAGELNKVVLARELRVEADRDLDPVAILGRLLATFPSAITFSVDGFIGASPELLVARSDDIVRAHPLAGTTPRHSDPTRDQQLAAFLLASAKNQWEHHITIDWLLDTLLPFCSYVDAEPEPTIVSLANVHHLGTLVEGRLSSPPASVLELVAALHPTPAVGGDPQATALAVIAASESGDRGRYGGPVGWVDASGNGAFAVGIRSAQLSGPTASLWAGVGVVADSDPEAELAETRVKFQAMLPALLAP